MINLIHGDIGQGKTTRLLSLYHTFKKADGFTACKFFHNFQVIGYQLVHLNSDRNLTLALAENHTPVNWDEIYTMGKFSFSRKAFQWAEKIIDQCLEHNKNPIFIDEVGPLEIMKKGHYHSLMKIIHQGNDLFITVRNECIQDVIQLFNLTENQYQLIEA